MKWLIIVLVLLECHIFLMSKSLNFDGGRNIEIKFQDLVGIKTAPGPESLLINMAPQTFRRRTQTVTGPQPSGEYGGHENEVDSSAGWKTDDDHFFVVLFHYPFVKTAFGKNIRKREKLYLIINFSKEYLIE